MNRDDEPPPEIYDDTCCFDEDCLGLIDDHGCCMKCGWNQDEETRPAKEPPGLRQLFESQRKWTEGMEPNPNGHRYGCECTECMDFYRSLK